MSGFRKHGDTMGRDLQKTKRKKFHEKINTKALTNRQLFVII